MGSRELEHLVDHYLAEWDGSGWAHAFHSLIELGETILPLVESRFSEARAAAFRAELVALAQQMHSERAIDLLALALEDAAPAVWKAALDGLVDLSSDTAIAILEAHLDHAPTGTPLSEWRGWIREALDQTQEAKEARRRIV